jgi:hypothetical protein
MIVPALKRYGYDMCTSRFVSVFARLCYLYFTIVNISPNRACNLIYITFNDPGEISIITRLRGNMLFEVNINTSNVCHISIGVM